MSKDFLRDYQKDAVDKMRNGCILNGGVGSGKSRTGLYYYFKENGGSFIDQKYVPMKKPQDLYIITTAMKRDSHEWDSELANYRMSTNPEQNKLYPGQKIIIDSWNNIKKYAEIHGAFFIFDEDRVCGSGAWVKAFQKIARGNNWIILSATPGDCWADYIPVFVANGFYKNKTEFCREHAYSVMLTSEAYTFVGGTGGVGANQSCTTEAVAFCGNNQCSVVTVDAKSIVCPTGISAAVSNSGTSKVTIKFTTTATVNAACEATIPVSVDGITINKKFSFAVARTGNTGATGKGIKGTPVTEYVASTGNTTPPTSGWSTSIPSVAQGQYLWTRVTTTYTDNSTSVSYSVAKQGSTGATGTTGSQWYAGTGITGTSTTATAFADSGVANARVNDMYLNTSTGNTYKCTVAGNATNAKWVYAGNIKGVQGDKGNTGATGNGISKADITYAASSSNTSAPTSGWQSTPPSVNPGQYLWTKTVFTYTNGGTATQYSVAKQGNTGAAGADAITVSITSSNGTVFKNNSGSTVLTAHVYKGAVEQTVADNGTVSGLGTIKWYTVGSDTAVATAKTLTVSANDVDNTQAYTCQLEG